MRFPVDDQLPPALAHLLSAAGHKAEHTCDVGLRGLPDEDVRAYAAKAGAAIITKDQDFVIAQVVDPACPPVVWLRIGKTRKAALLQYCSAVLPRIVSQLESGERVVELR